MNRTGNRIVAKVTVKLKVHILYQSSILQWISYKDWLANNSGSDKSEWHASIKEINPSTGLIKNRVPFTGEISTLADKDDGTWFQTSTYFAVTR